MYSTIEKILNKINQSTLIQLLNDEGRSESSVDLTDANDDVVKRFNQAAGDAKDEIDPFVLGGGYTIPFVTVPKLIVTISDDITIYNIYKRRMRDNMPDSIVDIYKQAMKKLEQVQMKKLDLGIPKASAAVPNSGEFRVNKTASDRIFNDRMWRKY